MLRAVGTWLYDKDAFEALEWQGPLEEFKRRVKEDPGVFGGLIRKYLLENKHR